MQHLHTSFYITINAVSDSLRLYIDMMNNALAVIGKLHSPEMKLHVDHAGLFIAVNLLHYMHICRIAIYMQLALHFLCL